MRSSLVIDVSYAVHRCANVPALAALKTSTHIPTCGIFGFLRMINALLRDRPQFSEIICAFDKGPYKRSESFPEYKADREPEAGTDAYQEKYGENEHGWSRAKMMTYQFNVLRKLLPMMKVKTVCVRGYEADDLVYEIVRRRVEDHHVVVMSDDYDYLQLIHHFPAVEVHRPLAEKWYNANNFAEMMDGIPANWYIVTKAMLGDSDNIPQCALGFGWKSAFDLMNLGIAAGLNPDVEADLDKLPELAANASSARIRKYDAEAHKVMKRNLVLMDFKHIFFTDQDILNIEEQLNQELKFDFEGVTEIFQKHELKSLADLLARPTFRRLT